MKELTKGAKITESGLAYIMLKEGSGAQAEAGKTVSVHYTGTLADGKTFISTQVIIGINLETLTFSIVELINPNLACIIGAGTGFRFVQGEGSKKTNVRIQMQTN